MLAWYATVAEAAVVTDGLVSYWTFDESTIQGDTVEDIFGDNDGTVMGAPEMVEFAIGEALHFDGTDDYVEVESNESLELQDAFTMDNWVKGDSEPDTGSGFSRGFSKGRTVAIKSLAGTTVTVPICRALHFLQEGNGL